MGFMFMQNNLNLDGVHVHAHRNKKHIRGNDKPFLTEALSKTIMQRTRFRNNSLEISTDTKQRHMCLSLLGKEKNTYFENINKKDTKDSRNF